MRASIRKPLFIFVSLLLFAGCKNGSRKDEISNVSLTTAITKPTNKTYTFQSTLEAKDNVRLAAQVVGRIRSIDVQEGGQVRKGQLLYTLEQIYEKKLKEAQTAKAKLNAKNARRYEFLNQQGAISDKMKDEYVASAEYSQAIQESLNAMQGYKIINSPIKGTVTSIDIKQGSITSIGEPIFNIIDNSTLEARVSIPVSFSDIIQINKPVDLFSRQGGLKIGEGRISFISPSINKGTQTFLVKALFDNNKGGLKHHEKVTVKIQGESKNSLLIPTRSIFRTAGQAFVFKAVGVEEAQKLLNRQIKTRKGFQGLIAIQTPIKVASHGKGESEVLSGLKDGDKIVANNQHLLSNGMPIN